MKRACNAVLFLLTVLSVYSHLMVDEKFERTAPALVFFFMLSCRLVVEFQNERKLLKRMQALTEEANAAAAALDDAAAAAATSKAEKVD